MANKNKFFQRKLSGIIVFLAVAFTSMPFDYNCVSAKNTPFKGQIGIENKNLGQTKDILSVIDKYQAKYFTIIKRNNVFLNLENYSELNNDRKELKKLFKKVRNQIANKGYLKEYKQIEKKYSKCSAETTIEINEFAQKYYEEIDALLNKIYKEIKTKISSEDFKKLSESERRWLKEVSNYEKVYDSMNFGTIGTSIYYEYQTNMKSFRTLLLMLYL